MTNKKNPAWNEFMTNFSLLHNSNIVCLYKYISFTRLDQYDPAESVLVFTNVIDVPYGFEGLIISHGDTMS